MTVNPAPQHPRRRGPGAGSSAVQRWLSPVSHQGLGGCPWSRGATGNFGANFANFFLGVKRAAGQKGCGSSSVGPKPDLYTAKLALRPQKEREAPQRALRARLHLRDQAPLPLVFE